MSNSPDSVVPAGGRPEQESLVKRSFGLLKEHPSLIVFPIITSVVTLGVMVAFARTVPPDASYKHRLPLLMWQITRVGKVWATPHPALLGIFYLFVTFLGTASNVALYSEVIQIYAGKRVSILRGFKTAFQKSPSILSWSLFSATIGIVIQLLGSKLGWIGKIAGFGASVMWSVASVFIYPVLAREGLANPLTLLRRSESLVKSTWGDLVVGYAKISMGIAFVLMIPCVVFYSTGMELANPFWQKVLLVAGFGGIILVAVFTSTVQIIFRTALYIYATEGVAPGPFDRGDMDRAWKIKAS